MTEYRFGFGYQATEHFTFDLMLQSTRHQNLVTGGRRTIELPGSGKGISIEVIYASVVLAF